jgi:TolB protein
MRWRGHLFGGLVLAVLLIAATTAQAAFPGRNGSIAFHSTDSAFSTGDISTVNPDGTGAIRLLGPLLLDAAWSPDGTRIAFTNCGGRNGCDIDVMNADGSGVKELVSYRSTDRTPAWSPDGTRILFASGGPLGESSTWDTYVIAVDGTGATKVSDHGALEAEWSPDGQSVFFAEGESRYPAPGGGIWRMRPDGSGAVRLVGGEPDVIYESPTIAPDGAKLAFSKTTSVVAGKPCCSEIFTMNTDGTDVRQITRSGASHVAWSPDGTKLVIDGLATVSPDGGGLQELGVTGSQPDWQPLPFKNDSKQCKTLPGDNRNHGQCVKGAH